MASGFNFGGIASGLDTNSIIAQLIAIERRPQVRMKQQQTIEEARNAILRDVDAKLTALASTFAGLRDATLWADTQKVTVADATKLDAVRTGGAATGSYQLEVVDLARAQQKTQGTGAGGSVITAAGGADTLRIQVGTGTAVDVPIASGDTIAQIATKINGTTDIPVYASAVDGKLVLTAKNTGTANTITVSDGDTTNGYDLAAELNVAETLAAKNARYKLDGGAEQQSATNTVTNAIVGLTLTLKAPTAAGTATTITVGAPGPDTDAITKKVQAFVDEYNTFTEFVRGKLDEKKVANPKSDFERTKGALAGDARLSALLSSLRSAVADAFGGRGAGDPTTMAEIGVSTGATTGAATLDKDAVKGRLKLDAAKLSAQLARDVNDVKALFTNDTGVYSTKGLVQRLDGIATPWTSTGGFLDSRVASGDSRISTLKTRSAELDTRLALRERALRAQFTAMEQALSASQSQGSWLSAQIAGLG